MALITIVVVVPIPELPDGVILHVTKLLELTEQADDPFLDVIDADTYVTPLGNWSYTVAAGTLVLPLQLLHVTVRV